MYHLCEVWENDQLLCWHLGLYNQCRAVKYHLFCMQTIWGDYTNYSMVQSNLWRVILELAYALHQAQLGSYDIVYGLGLVPRHRAVQCDAQLLVQVEAQLELQKRLEIHHKCFTTENLQVSWIEGACVHCLQVRA